MSLSTELQVDSCLPQDIKAMLDRLRDLPIDQGFAPGSKLFVYQEVIDLNDEAIKATEYVDTGLFHQIILLNFLC
jgi:hypothetical protein